MTMYTEKSPTCTCGAELEFEKDEIVFSDGNTIEAISEGSCPNCEKRYRWSDFFELSYFSNMKEISNEEQKLTGRVHKTLPVFLLNLSIDFFLKICYNVAALSAM